MAASRRPGAHSGASRFPFAPTEAELRRLAGERVFAETDTWEKNEHVLEPRVGVDAAGQEYLIGRVLGSWRRADEAIITADSRGISTRCSCGAAGRGELCRHAVTLLLHWARHPSSFQMEVLGLPSRYADDIYSEDYLDEDFVDDEIEEVAPAGVSPREHLARLLSGAQMNYLRQIARERGLRVTAKTKAELVERLAEELSTPESLNAALAGLDSAEMDVLVLADLLAGGGRAETVTIIRAVRAMRQSTPESASKRGGAPPEEPKELIRLSDLGLVFHTSDYTGRMHYAVPVGVTTALDPRPDLLAAQVQSGLTPTPRTGLGLIEVMRVIVDAVGKGEIGKTVAPYFTGQAQVMPDAWVREPLDIGTQTVKGNQARRNARETFRLRPLTEPLAIADRLTLVERTGASVALVDFAVRCLFAIGALQIEGANRSHRVRANDEPLQGLSLRTPGDQVSGLSAIWLSLPDTLEMASVLGPAGASEGGPLEYRYTTDAYNRWLPAPSGAVALRRLIARLLGRLTASSGESRWYDLPALLDFLWRLDPGIIPEGIHSGAHTYGFTEPGRSTFLRLRERKQWQRLWKPLVAGMLSGPMTWLGLVDVLNNRDGTLSFRPRPAAGALVGRPPQETPAGPARPIHFSVDATEALYATVPPGYPDASVHGVFGAWGEMVGASAQGLCYSLHLHHLHQSFQEGMTGEQLLLSMARFAGGTLPADVEALLRRWADAYGSVRLYDDLTLIQVSDDFLLRELLATSSLAGAIMHTFSPRLAAVDPAQVDDLLAELMRLGHSPRVLEGT